MRRSERFSGLWLLEDNDLTEAGDFLMDLSHDRPVRIIISSSVCGKEARFYRFSPELRVYRESNGGSAVVARRTPITDFSTPLPLP